MRRRLRRRWRRRPLNLPTPVYCGPLPPTEKRVEREPNERQPIYVSIHPCNRWHGNCQNERIFSDCRRRWRHGISTCCVVVVKVVPSPLPSFLFPPFNECGLFCGRRLLLPTRRPTSQPASQPANDQPAIRPSSCVLSTLPPPCVSWRSLRLALRPSLPPACLARLMSVSLPWPADVRSAVPSVPASSIHPPIQSAGRATQCDATEVERGKRRLKSVRGQVLQSFLSFLALS